MTNLTHSRLTTLIFFVAAVIVCAVWLSGCSAVQPCITAHGPSIRLTDANGVVFSQASQTLEFCPGFISPDIGGPVVPAKAASAP